MTDKKTEITEIISAAGKNSTRVLTSITQCVIFVLQRIALVILREEMLYGRIYY